MPQVAIPFLMGGVGVAGLGAWTAAAWSAAFISGGLALVGNEVQKHQARSAQSKQNASIAAAAINATERKQTQRSSTKSRDLVFGEVRKAGHLWWQGNSGSGKDRYLWLVIDLAGHELSYIGEPILNGEELIHSTAHNRRGSITTPIFYATVEAIRVTVDDVSYTTTGYADLTAQLEANGYVVVSVVNGIDMYNADSDIIIESGFWDGIDPNDTGESGPVPVVNQSLNVESGARTATIWYYYGTENEPEITPLMEAFPNEWTSARRGHGTAKAVVRLRKNISAWPEGVPNITFITRSAIANESSNPGELLDWYLRWEEGANQPLASIDQASKNAAIAVCNEDVQVPGGGYQKRYTVNTVVDMSSSPRDIIDLLRKAMAGSAVWSMGRWKISAGAWKPPVLTLTAADVIGAIQVQGRPSRAHAFNTVRGTFVNPDASWEPTEYPEVSSQFYIDEDAGDVLIDWRNYDFITDGYNAQRLVWIDLNRHRQGLQASAPFSYRALVLEPGDTFNLVFPEFGWEPKTFEVINFEMTDDGIGLQIRETAPGVWSDDVNALITRDYAPNTTLDSTAYVPEIAGLRAETGTAHLVKTQTGVQARILISWDDPADFWAIDGGVTQIRHIVNNRGDFVFSPDVQNGTTSMYLAGVSAGEQITYWVRWSNRYGKFSEWKGNSITVVGKEEKPSDVQNFLVTRQPDGTREYTWDLVPDIDVKHGGGYEIRYSSNTSAVWEDMIVMHDGLITANRFENNQLPAGTYLIGSKAQDVTTLQSLNMAAVVVDLADPRLSNVVYQFDSRVSGWESGNYLNSATPDHNGSGYVYADSGRTWDEIEALTWDQWEQLQWQSAPVSVMAYSSLERDFGADVTVRLNPTIQGLNAGSVAIHVYTQLDGGAGTWQWFDASSAVFVTRYMRVVAYANRDESKPAEPYGLEFFRFVIDTDVKEENINDADTSTWTGTASAGRVIPISKPFVSVINIHVTLQNVGPGYTWELISKADPQAPIIKIYDATGTPADALADVTVKGII